MAKSRSTVKRAKKPAKAAKPVAKAKPVKVVLLSGGNPQIAMGEGDAPVQAYIKALPDWRSGVARRIDALVAKVVPKVRKAVKYNSPLYGLDGATWFLSLHAFPGVLRLTFFGGKWLTPLPPKASKYPTIRYFDIRERDVLDEKQLSVWLTQAAAAPGWKL